MGLNGHRKVADHGPDLKQLVPDPLPHSHTATAEHAACRAARPSRLLMIIRIAGKTALLTTGETAGS